MAPSETSGRVTSAGGVASMVCVTVTGGDVTVTVGTDAWVGLGVAVVDWVGGGGAVTVRLDEGVGVAVSVGVAAPVEFDEVVVSVGLGVVVSVVELGVGVAVSVGLGVAGSVELGEGVSGRVDVAVMVAVGCRTTVGRVPVVQVDPSASGAVTVSAAELSVIVGQPLDVSGSTWAMAAAAGGVTKPAMTRTRRT